MRKLTCVLFVAGLVVAACAQQKNVSVTASQADVRETLKALFAQTGFNYTVDPTVQGTVTVTLHEVSFETALRMVLRQVKATFTVESGVYIIAPVVAAPPPQDAGTDIAQEEDSPPELFMYQVMHADPWLIVALLRGEWVTQPEISTLLGGGLGGNGGMGLGGGRGSGGTGGFGRGFGGGYGGGFGAGNGFGQGNGGGQGTGFGSQSGSGFQGGGPGQRGGRGLGGGQSGNDGWFIDPATNRIYRLPQR